MFDGNNSTADDVFEIIYDHPDRWSCYEKLHPKIRKALQDSPVDFGVYDTWKCQVEFGVKRVLEVINTEASKLSVCGILPLGVNEKWVIK